MSCRAEGEECGPHTFRLCWRLNKPSGPTVVFPRVLTGPPCPLPASTAYGGAPARTVPHSVVQPLSAHCQASCPRPCPFPWDTSTAGPSGGASASRQRTGSVAEESEVHFVTSQMTGRCWHHVITSELAKLVSQGPPSLTEGWPVITLPHRCSC